MAITNLDRLVGLGTVKVCTAYRLNVPPDGGLDQFFEWVPGGSHGTVVIRGIRVPSQPSQAHQEELGELLARCEPELLEFRGWNRPFGRAAKRYLRYLEEELGVPISLVSLGPKATDKVELA